MAKDIYDPANYDTAPTYLKSADLHNLGAGNDSMVDTLANAPSNIVKFSTVSLASGINSIYNTAVSVANWFGADVAQNDVAQSLSAFDSDLGAYYSKNKESADVVGFVATSFIPGLGGVKLFNTGQKMLKGALETGTIGSTLAKATGLVKSTDEFVVAASAQLAESQSAFTIMNANVIKALGSGVQQSFMESIAFEASVAATMNQSPILSNADYKDIASNILTGGLLGGAIGGVFASAVSYGKITTAIKAADKETAPFRTLSSTANLSASDRILVSAGDIGAAPLPSTPKEVELLSSRVTKLNQNIRTDTHELTKGDVDLGNVVADSLHGMDPNQIANVMRGATGIHRLGTAVKAVDGEQIGYAKLIGADAGKVTWEIPTDVSLADKLANRDAVNKFVADHKFDAKKQWSMFTAGGPDEIEARYIWAERKAKYTEGMTIDATDIPLLEGALRNKLTSIKIQEPGDYISVVTGVIDDQGKLSGDLYNQIVQSKKLLATELTRAKNGGWAHDPKRPAPISSNEIAKAVNVHVDALENTEGASLFARADERLAYQEVLKAKRIKPNGVNDDLDYLPKNIGVRYSTKAISESADAGMVEAMVMIKQNQLIQQEATDKVVSRIVGDEAFSQLAHPTQEMILGANRQGAGATMIGFANAGYGTVGGWAEQVGAVTARVMTKMKQNTDAIIASSTTALRGDQDAAIEFYNIHQMAQKAARPYVMKEDGSGLILKDVWEYNLGITKEAPTLREGVLAEIPFRSTKMADTVQSYMSSHYSRIVSKNELRQSMGLEGTIDPYAFYPMKANSKDYPFFAFVKDETVTGAGAGHTSMLHASTEEELSGLIKMVKEKAPTFSVYTKKEAEDFYKAQKAYEYDRTLHENYIDSSLRSRGIYNNPIPKTDPNAIVDEWLKHEGLNDTVLARDTISAKYSNEFDQFRTLGEGYTNVAASRFGGTTKVIESTVKNPYMDYAKTALNISRLSEYPILTSLNKSLENAVSSVYTKVENAWKESKITADLPNVNAALERAGISHAFKNASEVLLANHSAPKPILSQWIRNANSILASTFLRTDPLNALNNAVGAQVLLGKETASLVRGIKQGNEATAGKLAELLEIGVPGTEDKIKAPAKLIANAIASFVKGAEPEAEAMFRANGWMKNTTDQYRSMLEDLTLGGTETPNILSKKIQDAFTKARALTETAEKFTGNKLAEDFNRYVSAHVAKQISDLGVEAGLIDAKTQLSYINTFVNRTQGNVLASQRPLIFQGPIGQAIGLFQTFQFNTMQQLFRGVAESGAKDAALTLGLQGTIYGLNGLPGFQFINQHIVGTASGNKEHKDAYTATYGTLGKGTADWLMYGIPSNILQTNLYTRGDINPRTLTIVPTSPGDIVSVQAFGKFIGSVKDTLTKVANGGAIWESTLQGIEHNGLSRPLAGLAQTLQATTSPGHKAFSTTSKGDISFVNDWFSLTTMSRLAGGKPLDEALANDEISRSIVYKAKDRERMKDATEAFKTNIIGGKGPAQNDVENYLERYVRNGGNQQDFNKQMLNVMTKVDVPKANQIIQSLKGPYGQHMQLLMGGKLDQFPQID